MKVHKRDTQSAPDAEARKCGEAEFGTNPLEKCNVTCAEIVAFASPTGKSLYPLFPFFFLVERFCLD